MATEWNHHTIRLTSSAYVPAGCPEVLYFMPEAAGMHWDLGGGGEGDGNVCIT